MKHAFIITSIIVACMQQTIFTAEKDEWVELQSFDQTEADHTIITTIDTAINKEYGSQYFLGIIAPKLATEEVFDIVNIAYQTHGHTFYYNDNLIATLYAKNELFKQAIDSFITQAHNNLESLNIGNLEIIEDPQRPQPNTQLNPLPSQIRSYVMRRALEQINHTYDIILTGHTRTIRRFDICEATHQAATAGYDYTFRLWDLATGKLTHTINEEKWVKQIKFNHDGSQVATSYKKHSIIIWCPKTGNALHTIIHPFPIQRICYAHPENFILAVLGRDNSDKKYISRWSTQTKNILAAKPTDSTYFDDASSTPDYKGTIYTADHPENNIIASQTELCVKKHNCGALYLLEKSIEKTQNKGNLTIEALANSQSYKNSTTLEKEIAFGELRKKAAALSAPVNRSVLGDIFIFNKFGT